MKLDYKGKKWDKEVANFQKFKKSVNGELNKTELYHISVFEKSGCKDYLTLYSLLSGCYDLMAGYCYMDSIESDELVKYEYLSGNAFFLTKILFVKGVRSGNENRDKITENIIIRDLDSALFRMIAVDEAESPLTQSEKENLIMLMYNKEYDKAKEILDQITDSPDDSKEVYYVASEFLKPIYMAIINNDEKAFNEELAKRIKKYRKNMVGYSTIIDVTSVALIKIAARSGIACTVDTIEIPKQFFGKDLTVLKSDCKLPYYDEFLKGQQI